MSNDQHRGPGFTIRECWIFAAVDPADDEEGVVGQMVTNEMGRVFLPFVATDRHRRDSLLARARELATSQGRTIRVIHLTGREVEEIIEP